MDIVTLGFQRLGYVALLLLTAHLQDQVDQSLIDADPVRLVIGVDRDGLAKLG